MSRLVLGVFFLAMVVSVEAQNVEPKKAAKQKAHKKPTAEQIRKFNELEKKQHKAAAKP